MAVTFGLAGVALVTGCGGGSQVTVPPPGATSTPVTSTPTPVPSATPTSSGAPTPTPSPSASSGFTPDNWPLVGHDAARSGVSNEVTGSHGAISLQKLWQTNLGGIADSGPIIEGSMLYVTVHDGTTYGIATSNGTKVWSFTTSGPNITTSEPAFDVAGNEVYAGGVDGKVHQLDPATGVENTKGGFPVLVTLATATEKDASPLNVASGYVYAQTSAYDGDGTPYVGHVVAISTATGQSQVFNTLCSSMKGLIQPATCAQNRSGMWSRAGVVVDPDPSMNGEIFVATGNGDSDPASGDYGDSVLGLAANAGSLVGSFAPSNAAMLEADDLDLGSSSPALIPRQPSSSTPLMAVSAGKDAMLHLLNRANLGGAPLQTLGLGSGLYSAPAVYASPSGTTYVYVGSRNGVTAYAVTTTNGATQLVVAWTASLPLGNEGTSPVVRDGVVYVAASNELVALDATTGAMLASNPSLGAVHWESPSIANGVVYCSDESGNLTAFKIVPQGGSSARVRKATDATSR